MGAMDSIFMVPRDLSSMTLCIVMIIIDYVGRILTNPCI